MERGSRTLSQSRRSPSPTRQAGGGKFREEPRSRLRSRSLLPLTPKHPSHFAITHRFIPIGSQQESRHPVRCSFHDPCNLFHRRPLFAFHNRFVMDMHIKGQSIPKDDLASIFYLSTFPIIRKSHWIQQDNLRSSHSIWLVLSNNRMACYRASFHKLHMLNMKYQEQMQFPSV